MASIALPGTGEILGPYRLQRPLASGEGGSVFIAEHGVLKRLVVLKVAPAPVPATFFAEARAARASAHPHVVVVLDLVDKGNRRYVSFELLRGRSLADVVKEGLALPRAVHIARQIAEALEAVHAASIVHRDVKPANVFLADVRNGRDGDQDFVKLLDIAADGSEGKKVPPGAVVGSPLYMAPELLKQQGGDHRTDIYAFGVLLCELLTGRRPFEGSTNDIVKAHLLTPPPLPSSLAPVRRIPEPLDLLVQECLAKTVDARPASMQEVGLALGAVAELVGVHRPKPGTGDPPDTIAMPRLEGGWKPLSLSESSSSQAQRRRSATSGEASTSGPRPPTKAERVTVVHRPPPASLNAPIDEQPTMITVPPSGATDASTQLEDGNTPAYATPAPLLRADTPPAAPPPGCDPLFDEAQPERPHHDTSPTHEFTPTAQAMSPTAPSIDPAELPDIPPPLADKRPPWIAIAAAAAVIVVAIGIALVLLRQPTGPSVIPTAVAVDVPAAPQPTATPTPEAAPPPKAPAQPKAKPVEPPALAEAAATAEPQAEPAVAEHAEANDQKGTTEKKKKKKNKKKDTEAAKKEGDLLNPFGD